MGPQLTDKIAVVAIARDEKPFMDEWLLYHRLIGVDHFLVYDDDPNPGLQEFLNPHREYTTVLRWYDPKTVGTQQLLAYRDALNYRLSDFQWVAFIDLDEFIVLDKHANLKEFIASLGDASAARIIWHRFGHNGRYDDPTLVTAELTRRKLLPCTNRWKSLTRCDAIANITCVHNCDLKQGYSFEVTDAAHINHYMCRSFTRWMNRPERGDANDLLLTTKNAWKHTKRGCLRKFVERVALDWNEHEDKSMLKFKQSLEQAITAIRTNHPGVHLYLGNR